MYTFCFYETLKVQSADLSIVREEYPFKWNDDIAQLS